MEKIDVTPEELYDIIEKLDKNQTSINAEAKKRGMDRSTLSKKIKDYRANPVKVVAEHMDKEFQQQQLNNQEPEQLTNPEKGPEPENVITQVIEKALDSTAKTLEKAAKLQAEKAHVKEESEKAPVEKITFTLSKDLIRAIRMKAANEDVKIIDMVKDAFYEMVEPKYFKKL